MHFRRFKLFYVKYTNKKIILYYYYALSLKIIYFPIYHLNLLVQLLYFVGIKLVNSFNVNERFWYNSETIPSEFVTRPRRSCNHYDDRRWIFIDRSDSPGRRRSFDRQKLFRCKMQGELRLSRLIHDVAIVYQVTVIYCAPVPWTCCKIQGQTSTHRWRVKFNYSSIHLNDHSQGNVHELIALLVRRKNKWRIELSEIRWE